MSSVTPRRFRRRTIAALVLLLLVLAADAVLVWRRGRYREETARLRASMSALERERADAIVEAEKDEAGLMLELMRRQATADEQLHLAVSADSAFVALDRGAARLRSMPAQFGGDAVVGAAQDSSRMTRPLGARSIEQLLGPGDAYTLPRWVWASRGLPVPEQRSGVGWAGEQALVTSGGTLIYTLPKEGPLADSAYVMPGTVRVRPGDLAAIRESLTRGMTVYFY